MRITIYGFSLQVPFFLMQLLKLFCVFTVKKNAIPQKMTDNT